MRVHPLTFNSTITYSAVQPSGAADSVSNWTGAAFDPKRVRRGARIAARLSLPIGPFRILFWSLAILLPILGARMAGAQNVVTYQETAALTGEVFDGGTIPLPRYQDDTEALESECRWTVNPKAIATPVP